MLCHVTFRFGHATFKYLPILSVTAHPESRGESLLLSFLFSLGGGKEGQAFEIASAQNFGLVNLDFFGQTGFSSVSMHLLIN